MKELWQLFSAFARIGGFTFGGGYAMLPMLQKEVVEKYKWVTEDEVLDYYAIGQCTPGIIMVNTATFVGQKICGVLGGVFATLGIVFPSLVIIIAIAALISNFADIPAVQNAFAGIRVCVCVLVLNSVVKLWKNTIKDRWALVIFLLVFLAAVFTELSPAVFVLLAALAGVAIKGLEAKNK